MRKIRLGLAAATLTVAAAAGSVATAAPASVQDGAVWLRGHQALQALVLERYMFGNHQEDILDTMVAVASVCDMK